MPKILVTVAFVGCAATLACGNPNGPRAGLTIVSGDKASDTVGSIFKPPLTVVLLDGNLQPMQGQTVYFNTNGFVLVAPIEDPGFVINRLPATTDASGYGGASLRTGPRSRVNRPGTPRASPPVMRLVMTVCPSRSARRCPSETRLSEQCK